MSEPTASVGATDASAPAGVIAESAPAPAATETPSESTQATETTESTAASGTTETAETESLEAPEQSSPEQKGRWAKLRDKAERAETRATDLEQKYSTFAPLEPVRDQILGLVQGLSAEMPDSDSIEDALAAIDREGANYFAGHILEKYGPYRDQQVYGASPDEIRAALTAYRSGAAPVQQAQQYEMPVQQRGARPASVTEDWDLLSPETQAYIAAQEARARQLDQQRQDELQQRDEGLRMQRVEAYNAQFYPMIRQEIADTWKVTDPEGQIAFWQGVEASIARVQADAQVIENAKKFAASERLYAANQSSAAVQNILKRHIDLVGNALYRQQQAAQIAATEAATAKAASVQPPQHVAGSTGAVASANELTPLRDRLTKIFAEGAAKQ